MNHTELIEKLGGVNATARLLRIKPPSVTGWSRTGVIPEQRLIRLAVIAEQRGIAKRQEFFPGNCQEIWPELCADKTPEVSSIPDGLVPGPQGLGSFSAEVQRG